MINIDLQLLLLLFFRFHGRKHNYLKLGPSAEKMPYAAATCQTSFSYQASL
jgi:hypothetical protein